MHQCSSFSCSSLKGHFNQKRSQMQVKIAFFPSPLKKKNLFSKIQNDFNLDRIELSVVISWACLDVMVLTLKFVYVWYRNTEGKIVLSE